MKKETYRRKVLAWVKGEFPDYLPSPGELQMIDFSQENSLAVGHPATRILLYQFGKVPDWERRLVGWIYTLRAGKRESIADELYNLLVDIKDRRKKR